MLIAGCGFSSSSAGGNVLSVIANPNDVTVGDTVNLQARFGPSGSPQDVTHATQWSVSNSSLATLQNGVLVTNAPGTVTVQASYTAPDANGNSKVVTSSTQVKIAQHHATVTWNPPAPIQYGASVGSAQLNATADVPGSFAYTPAAGTVLAAGSQTLSVTFTPKNTNAYSSVSLSVPLTVNKAPLSVTAINETIPAGTPIPVLSGTISGLVNNDRIAAAYTTTATSSSPAGSYPITPALTGAALANYQVGVHEGTLTLSNAALVVAANNASKIYGTANPALTGSLQGLLPGDQVNVTYTTTATSSSPVGSYVITPVLSGPSLSKYKVTTNNGTLSVTKASPVITWATPASVTSGAVLSSAQLNAAANVPGTFTYNPPAGTVLTTGTLRLTTAFTPADAINYNSATATTTMVVGAAPVLVATANNASRVYGAANPALTGSLQGLLAGDQVTVTYATAATAASPAGSYAITPVLSGASLSKYAVTTNNGTLSVTKATPVINWAISGSFTSGTALSSAQLNATANVPGSFTYSPAAGAELTTGTQQLTAIFTPADATDYNTANATAIIVVSPAPTLVVTASNATKVYGTANPALTGSLQGLQPGDDVTATYTTAATTSSAAGSYAITPALSGASLSKYNVTLNNGTLSVTKATPVVTWTAPASVSSGTALSGVQLNATANVPGTFAYSPAAGTVLTTGSQQLTAVFTPADNTDYNSANATTAVVVGPAPTLVVTADNASRLYGAANPVLTGSLQGLLPGDQVTAAYTTTATASSPVGSYPVTPVLSGASLSKYAVTTNNGTLSVTKATPVVTWAAPASVVSGTALSGAQLNASANVPGTFNYSPAAGTVLTTGTQQLTATFTPTDAVDYNAGTASTSLVVTAPPTLTSIQISISSTVLQIGKSLQCTASGAYSDGSTKDLTGTAAWTSSSASIAQISSSGQVTGAGQGTTQIAASLNGVSSAPVTLQIVSSGKVINVDPSMAMAQIQSAVNGSSPGDTVAFAAGTYNWVSPGVRLQPGRSYLGSTNGISTVSGAGGYALMTFYGAGLTVQNFTFNAGGLFLGGAVSGINVEHNTFQNFMGGQVNWTSENPIDVGTTAANSDFSYNTFLNIGSDLVNQYNDHDKPTGIYVDQGLSGVTISYNSFDTFIEGIHVFYNQLDGNNVHVTHNTFLRGHDLSIEQQNGQGGHAQGLEVAYNSVSEPLNGWALTFGISVAATADIGTGIIIHDNYLNANQPKGATCTGTGCGFPYAIEAWGNNTQVYNNIMEGNWGIGVGIGAANNLLVENNAICGPSMAAASPQTFIQQYYGPQPGTQAINNITSSAMTCSLPTASGAAVAAEQTANITRVSSAASSTSSDGVVVLRAVSILPAKVAVGIGSTAQLKAVAIYSDGSVKDVSSSFAWLSSDTRTATVSAAGLVSGLASGRASVSGSYQGMRASSTVSSAIGKIDWGGPIVIRHGGTYSGNWQSADPATPAVIVETTEPVILESSHLRGRGDLIVTAKPGSDLTVRNTVAVALNPHLKGQANGIFIDAASPARLDVENNYVENAREGVRVRGYAGKRDGRQTVIVRGNRARNVMGLLSDGAEGYLPSEGSHIDAGFVRLEGLSSVPGIDLGWNEVIDYPRQSLAGDVVSTYQASGTANSPLEVHDTYIQGALPYNPVQDAYSGGGITTEGAAQETAKEASAYNIFHDNQVVASANYGIRFAAGHDNAAYNNRVVSSGLLADGSRIAAESTGMVNADVHGTGVASGSMFANSMRDNLIGVVCWAAACSQTGNRSDQFLPLASSDEAANTSIPAESITREMEDAEYRRWQTKLANSGMPVGPSF